MKHIFIGGCERSGTTFLASMLSCAQGVVVTPESQFKIELLNELASFLGSRNLWRLKMWGMNKTLTSELVVQCNNGVEALERLVDRYAYQQGLLAKIWIDHTPANMSQCSRLAKYFPDARFVHIIRHMNFQNNYEQALLILIGLALNLQAQKDT